MRDTLLPPSLPPLNASPADFLTDTREHWCRELGSRHGRWPEPIPSVVGHERSHLGASSCARTQTRAQTWSALDAVLCREMPDAHTRKLHQRTVQHCAIMTGITQRVMTWYPLPQHVTN